MITIDYSKMDSTMSASIKRVLDRKYAKRTLEMIAFDHQHLRL